MTICTACNWTRHDVAVHGPKCRKGHPLAVVGQTANGSCKRCRADRAKAHYQANREAENARSRAYHAAHREAIIARKRSKRSYRAVIGQRRGHRGAIGAPPPADHAWRTDAPLGAPGETTGPSIGGRSVAGPQARGRVVRQ